MEPKRCELDPEKICDDCGECDRCDLDPSKRCDNCMKCMQQEGNDDYRVLNLGHVRIVDPNRAKAPQPKEAEQGSREEQRPS